VLASAQAISDFGAPKGLLATFTLIVTLLTSLDTWLKPGVKFAAYYLANDEYEALRRELTFARNEADLKSIHEVYAGITARLRAVVTPAGG
jgi:hypothetical protein